MFEGFTLEEMDVGEVVLRLRHGGQGPPVLLLHGHPRSHATGTRVAPRLAALHTVVCPDLRGYGRSALPPDEPDHASLPSARWLPTSLQLMRSLGHDRFAVVGHDRGSLVALRAALDHPDVVTHLVIMDGLPLVEHMERLNEQFVRTWWHWWFMGQTDKPAERVICADPDGWYTTPSPELMGAEAHADLWQALRDPAVVHGMCEDYRPASGSTGPTKRPIGLGAGRLPARCCSCRPRTMTSTSTVTPWPSGVPGSPVRLGDRHRLRPSPGRRGAWPGRRSTVGLPPRRLLEIFLMIGNVGTAVVLILRSSGEQRNPLAQLRRLHSRQLDVPQDRSFHGAR